MTVGDPQPLGRQIALAYGRSLAAHDRQPGPYAVFGSNGQVGWHNKALVEGPGIIVGRKGSVGEIDYSSNPFWPIDTTYYVVNRHGHNWRFLYYLLRHVDLTELNSHSAVPGLNREDVYSISAWFPDPATQSAIARVLDSITNLLRLEIAALEVANKLKRSAMRDLFRRGVRREPWKETEIGQIPESWLLEPISAHHTVVSGGTPSRGNATYWVGGSIPWVKTTEVNYCVINETEEHITQAGLDMSAAKLLSPGTLLLAMYGQGVTRGKVAILGIKAACNQACAAISPSDSAVDTRYLYYFLTSQYEVIRQLAHGGQQQNLNLEIVRDLKVAFPQDKDEQVEIAAILKAIDDKIELHQQKRGALEQLFRALLHKLMAGEIRIDQLDLSALQAA